MSNAVEIYSGRGGDVDDVADRCTRAGIAHVMRDGVVGVGLQAHSVRYLEVAPGDADAARAVVDAYHADARVAAAAANGGAITDDEEAEWQAYAAGERARRARTHQVARVALVLVGGLAVTAFAVTIVSFFVR